VALCCTYLRGHLRRPSHPAIAASQEQTETARGSVPSNCPPALWHHHTPYRRRRRRCGVHHHRRPACGMMMDSLRATKHPRGSYPPMPPPLQMSPPPGVVSPSPLPQERKLSLAAPRTTPTPRLNRWLRCQREEAVEPQRLRSWWAGHAARAHPMPVPHAGIARLALQAIRALCHHQYWDRAGNARPRTRHCPTSCHCRPCC
jgi:hypothetical protein